jgi:predicted transglutaminase-like cysteine proteinase
MEAGFPKGSRSKMSEHDPEKWKPVFRKDHAPKRQSSSITMPYRKISRKSRASGLSRVVALAVAVLLALVEGRQYALASDAVLKLQEAKIAAEPVVFGTSPALPDKPTPALVPTAVSLQNANEEPFQSSVFRIAEGPLAHTWQAVRAGVVADLATLALCRARAETCSRASDTLLRIIAEGRARDGLARIGVINRAINLAIKPTEDPYAWRSALDTLSVGRGDCKDYAVSKYVALLAAGFAERDVKIVVVHDMAVNQDHAIVTVHFNGDWIVLDNRWLALVRDAGLRRAVPLYVLDENGAGRFGREVAKSSSPAHAAATN